MAKKEFGSHDGQIQALGNQDSGYVSHGSGGGYPKMQLPVRIKNGRSKLLIILLGFQYNIVYTKKSFLDPGTNGSIYDVSRQRVSW